MPAKGWTINVRDGPAVTPWDWMKIKPNDGRLAWKSKLEQAPASHVAPTEQTFNLD